MLKMLNQCDSRWGYLKLGESSESLCSAGCVTVILSVLSDWYGSYINPGKLVAKLKYTNKGLYYWKSGDAVLPFTFVYRYYKRDDKKIKEILYSKDNACILQVNNYKHWVLLVGYSRMFGYRVFDPLRGDIVYLSKRYGRGIQGFAEFTRK